MKELASGLKVDSETYYKLLEWKDKNYEKFLLFCDAYNLKHHSINQIVTEGTYNALIDYADI